MIQFLAGSNVSTALSFRCPMKKVAMRRLSTSSWGVHLYLGLGGQTHPLKLAHPPKNRTVSHSCNDMQEKRVHQKYTRIVCLSSSLFSMMFTMITMPQGETFNFTWRSYISLKVFLLPRSVPRDHYSTASALVVTCWRGGRKCHLGTSCARAYSCPTHFSPSPGQKRIQSSLRLLGALTSSFV